MYKIDCGGFTITRKVKFHVEICDVIYPAISASHAASILKSHGHHFSACDVYNYCNRNRPKKRLIQRLAANIKITKIPCASATAPSLLTDQLAESHSGALGSPLKPVPEEGSQEALPEASET